LNFTKQKSFAFRVLPLFIIGHILLLFQKTDVGGAKRDARVGHLPLIRYIADNHHLPFPGDYHVANIPLWHFLAAALYQITNSTLFISIFQLVLAVTTLLLLDSLLKNYVSESIAILLVSVVAINSYFISSSHFPTTDGMAIFTFTLFFYSLHKLLKKPESRTYLLLVNIAITISALNRQMFVILFLVYGFAFFKKKSIYRIFFELLPSLLLVLSGVYLFYVRYCDFLNSDVCWPIRQSRDLVFPVVVNLPVTCSLILVLLFPIFFRKEIVQRKIFPIHVLSFVTIFIFMEIYGSKKILTERGITGGGFYKFRELLGPFSIVFDVISLGLFLVMMTLIFQKFKDGLWVFKSIIVIIASSIFGPYAFQRYFETYILILGTLFLAINSEAIFSRLKISLKHWSYFLIFFQISEIVASVFIRV
jgi:Dolichyl-phosphate-mannose-protein mannosyltransferase